MQPGCVGNTKVIIFLNYETFLHLSYYLSYISMYQKHELNEDDDGDCDAQTHEAKFDEGNVGDDVWNEVDVKSLKARNKLSRNELKLKPKTKVHLISELNLKPVC